MSKTYSTAQSIKTLLNNINITSGYGGAGAIGGNGGAGVAGQNNIFSLFNDNVKKYEMYESKEDLLALSVCWRRIRLDKHGYKHGHISNLTDDALFKEVNSMDRDMAKEIRDYYSKKIMMLKLKSISLTNYRTDLNDFVHSDGTKFKEAMMPLAYRLPEFYEYDTEFETMARDYNKEIEYKPQANNTKKLSFIKKFTIHTRRQKRAEYWLSDDDKNLVRLSLDIHNPLLSLLDNSLSSPVKITARYTKRNRDGQEYFAINGYTFA